MSVEKTCCVVTVSESSSSQEQRHPVSCSGVVLNEQSGLIVLCSGTVFSPFLIHKECINQNPSILHANSFSNNMRVSIDRPDVTANSNVKNGHPRLHQRAELLLMVNCLEFQRAFQKIFIETEKWNFYSGDEDADITFDSVFLSWFAVLKIPGLVTSTLDDTIPWVKSTALRKGHSVLACGSPFGSFCPDLFMSTLSKGIVSNLAGEECAMILTDARCLPGTEGGGLFVSVGDTPHLVGLISSPLCWKSNEWIGLAIVCSFHLILKCILQAVTSHQSLRELATHSYIDIPHVSPSTSQKLTNGRYPTVAVVDSGQLWGSGILLNPRLVLTCRHVVDGKAFLHVRLNANKRLRTVSGRVLYSSKTSSPYDVAVVELQEPLSDVVSPQLGTRFIPGIVSSNTRDFAAKVTYPHLNFSIPVSVLEPLLECFSQTGNGAVFQALDSAEDDVRRVWRLQIPQSKL
ncbi:peroxisomal leader peptide-processing protease isoform X2 [Salminus brasiliensis]|uniref:peroxisomal leader peptide-processing protease isoform X2 n=1 Tax=Salminus brasiliensis TaxID=930266 RepID=UPI003B82E7C0